MAEAKESDAVNGLRWVAEYIHPLVLGEAVRKTLIKAADEIDQLKNENESLKGTITELDTTINNMGYEIDGYAAAFGVNT
jgi:hypothetical protein